MGSNVKATRSENVANAIPTKILAEMVLMIALASVLFFVRPFSLPQGGSPSLGAIPILLFSMRRGPKLGIMSGVIFGIIVLVLEPFVVHPLQLLLDYPLAFGALGISGFFRKHNLVGVAIGIIGRFLSHFVSGIVFFAMFAPEGMNPVFYSALYNGSYLSIEFIVSGIVIYGLIKRRILKVYC